MDFSIMDIDKTQYDCRTQNEKMPIYEHIFFRVSAKEKNSCVFQRLQLRQWLGKQTFYVWDGQKPNLRWIVLHLRFFGVENLTMHLSKVLEEVTNISLWDQDLSENIKVLLLNDNVKHFTTGHHIYFLGKNDLEIK